MQIASRTDRAALMRGLEDGLRGLMAVLRVMLIAWESLEHY
jgi:hypothetical protein